MFVNATRNENQVDLSRVMKSLDRNISVGLIESPNLSTENANSAWFKSFFNFTGYIIMAIYIAVVGLVMVDLNNVNIKKRIGVSSKKFSAFNLEVYLRQVSLGIIITGIFILGGILLRGAPLSDVNMLKHIVNLYVFSFAIICFTFLINNLTNSRFLVNGISTVVSLGTAFISGIWVPQELLSESVLNIAKFFPTYYFVNINNANVSSILDMKFELFMQLLFWIAFLLLGLYFSKLRQKSQ